MSNPQLYIDPECRLSKVPYKAPNNTHYVTLEEYERMRSELEAKMDLLVKTGDAMAFALHHSPRLNNLYAAEVQHWVRAKKQ